MWCNKHASEYQTKTPSLYVYDNEDAIANWTMDIINL